MGRISASQHINIHDISIRARLADISPFYRDDFDKRSVEDVDTLVRTLDEIECEANETIDELQHNREADESEYNDKIKALTERVKTAEAECKTAHAGHDALVVKLAEANDRIRQLESAIRQDAVAVELVDDSLVQRIRELEAKLAEARVRILVLAQRDEPTPREPRVHKAKPKDPTIELNFEALAKAHENQVKRGS